MASLPSETPAPTDNEIFDDVTLPTILCCICGLPIPSNPSSMCLPCLKSQVNFTDDIPKQNQLQWCRFCCRYLQPPNAWLQAELESRELLAICLKRIKGFGGRQEPRLVDAGFYWTEPHSRRIRVWLSLQAEVMGCIMQQKCCVEFQVLHLMCHECQRAETNHSWRATLQLRQRAAHKKTLLYLEQLLLKLQPHKQVTKIKQTADGLDFFFLQPDQARKLVDFFLEAVPCRYKTSKELISHDTHNNTYDYKMAYCVEVVPICRGDVVFIPKQLARCLGSISQGPLICYKVAQLLHLIDPLTLQTCEVSSTQYWRHQFPVLSHPKNVMQFLVLENEVDASFKKGSVRHSKGSSAPSCILSDVWLLRMHQGSALESDQNQIHTRTHLGHLLKPGDMALGFCLSTSNINLSYELQKDWDAQAERTPEVILLKKQYGDSGNRAKRRNWELKRLGEMEIDREEGLNEFLEELEEDKEMRHHVNIYKKPYAKRHQKKRKRTPAAMDVDGSGSGGEIEIVGSEAESSEDDAPVIELEEMLDDLSLAPPDK